ncbi:hypothetical protein AQJ91_05530 [Streptomyces dysideae]|uniref:Uncharacterized protein n=1 Tax=Streptomyces dysideae TaxID=909626 RepID=A0A101V3Y8_9ACTN|nr:hypothetical protein [Streptomyces dysideae]KUO22050.1 hypothetical protein AQJ91_05530 [Streptomyces dysideae]
MATNSGLVSLAVEGLRVGGAEDGVDADELAEGGVVFACADAGQAGSGIAGFAEESLSSGHAVVSPTGWPRSAPVDAHQPTCLAATTAAATINPADSTVAEVDPARRSTGTNE